MLTKSMRVVDLVMEQYCSMDVVQMELNGRAIHRHASITKIIVLLLNIHSSSVCDLYDTS